MTDTRWFPVIYMFIVTAVFSSVLIGFSGYTKQQVESNEALAFEKAVLAVLPGLLDDEMSGFQIHDRFVNEVMTPNENTFGAFALNRDGVTTAYALPFEGQGFWAPIKGIVGIHPDLTTILAVEFYEQNETPGLGGRITEPEYKDQFNSLKMQSSGPVFKMKRPGEPLQSGEVHAVTGATQTSVRLEKIINDAIKQWKAKMKGASI